MKKTEKQKIDVLWFIEHSAREMDVACISAILLAKKNIRVKIKNLYLHEQESVNNYEPQVIVTPFFYKSNDNAIGSYVQKWPKAKFINLAFEEIFYKGNEAIKAPQDEFSKQKVLHHAWGRFFVDYLKNYGVDEKNIFLNGNPVLELYRPPYKNFYPTKTEMAKKYHLDASAKWIFIPENYRWAFMPDGSIEGMSKIGGKKDEMLDMRRYCRESLKELLKWCNVAQENNPEIIFRPKPATSLKQMTDFFVNEVGSKSKHLHFIKDQSVREWILVCDTVISSFSTTLIEASVAEKPVFMVEPLPIPDSFQNDWYQFVPRIKNQDDFIRACGNSSSNKDQRLKKWAVAEMLSRGDPIANLADFIFELVKNKGRNLKIRSERQSFLGQANDIVSLLKFRIKPDTHHEMDFFTGKQVSRKIKQWSKII